MLPLCKHCGERLYFRKDDYGRQFASDANGLPHWQTCRVQRERADARRAERARRAAMQGKLGI